MNETIIKLSVRGQRLVCNAPDYLVSDNINYLDVLVDFSHESSAAWRGLDVWLHLRDETGRIYDVELKEGKAAKGLALSAGAWTAWLHGTGMTDGMPTIHITSDSTSFWVKHYAEERPGPLPAVPPTVAEQVAANAAWAKDQAQKLRQDMDGLDDAARRDSRVVWGTSYAVQADNTSTAGNAITANTINGHRLVEMTPAQFDQAVKDSDTYYLVYDPAAEVQA